MHLQRISERKEVELEGTLTAAKNPNPKTYPFDKTWSLGVRVTFRFNFFFQKASARFLPNKGGLFVEKITVLLSFQNFNFTFYC